MKNKNSKKELKIKKDFLKEYISMIPCGYEFDNESAKKVFAVLYFYSTQNNHEPFTLGMRTIADDALVSLMTVSRTVKLLAEVYGYINYSKGHLNTNSTYQIRPCTTVTSTVPPMIKNDMLQEESMLQQNVTAKMIQDGTANHIDTEKVTDVKENVNGTVTFDNSNLEQMLHKLKYKHKLNNNNNNLKSRNANKNKIPNNNMEKEIKEKGSLQESATAVLGYLEKFLEVGEMIASNLNTSSKMTALEDRITQLEEIVKKQQETISLLTSRLDNASRLFAEMKKNINSSSLTNSSSHQESATTNSNFDINLFEYNKAIREFYDLKDIDLKKASEKLDILNSLYEKLPQEKQAKIIHARKVYETLSSNSQDKIALPQTPSRFKELQSKFYDTIQEEASLERNTTLIETFRTLQSLKLTDLEQANMDKISDAFAKELSKSESLQKHFRINLINLNTKWKTAKQDGDWNQVLALAQAYQKEFLSFDRLPKPVLTALGVKDRLDLYKKDLKNNSHFFFHPILDYLREHSGKQTTAQQIYEEVANAR